MKQFLIILFAFAAIPCPAQFEKGFSLGATASFNLPIKGLATNNAGGGLMLDASILSKRKFQVLFETRADGFIGDKMLIVDSATGNKNKKASIYSFRAGPQFFIRKHLAVSCSFGPSWQLVRDFHHSPGIGFKYGITVYPGNQRRFITRLFLVDIQSDDASIVYLGLAAGYRFR